MNFQLMQNDAAVLNQNKQTNFNESLESDVLVEAIDETVTLNDLLARANQLETTVKQQVSFKSERSRKWIIIFFLQEFNKIQPLSRTNTHQRRKRFIIACTAILIILTIVITIVIVIVIRTLRHKKNTNYLPRSPSIYDG